MSSNASARLGMTIGRASNEPCTESRRFGTDRVALSASRFGWAAPGRQLVATAHGNALENLIMNPTLSDLIGGIQTVTLGDEEARRRGTQKSVLERKAPPTFDVLVEIQERERVAVHENITDVVD